MKKIYIMLSLFVVVLLSSCAANEAEINDFENARVDSIDSQCENLDEIDIQIIYLSSQGSDDYSTYAVSNAAFIDFSTNLPESFPAYVNNYSYGQTGPLYKVTDDLKNTISNNLSRYLECLYGDIDSLDISFSSPPDREHDVYFIKNSTEVYSRMNNISILSNDYSISHDTTDSDLLNNELVKAAIDYLGIISPLVTHTIEYKTDGTEYQRTYKITEKVSNIDQHILNCSFSYITVKKYADLNSIVIQIANFPIDSLTMSVDYSMLSSYATVTAKLSSYFPTMDSTSIKAELYYNAIIKPGYFIPCYRFYFKDETMLQNNVDMYTVVDVLINQETENN